jgi:hypothetical protein
MSNVNTIKYSLVRPGFREDRKVDDAEPIDFTILFKDRDTIFFQ